MANVATPKWLQDIAEKHGYNVELCEYRTKEYGSDYSVVFTSHFKKVMDPQPFFMNTIDDKEGPCQRYEVLCGRFRPARRSARVL